MEEIGMESLRHYGPTSDLSLSLIGSCIGLIIITMGLTALSLRGSRDRGQASSGNPIAFVNSNASNYQQACRGSAMPAGRCPNVLRYGGPCCRMRGVQKGIKLARISYLHYNSG
ncbi:uncharacterized protein BO95DRAFT_15279 [Aspergillus brunneoviolaceus CBS 621.78]|uniref:Uncharacterized protein n=1 Tax=Aspergillus brunneoviolaceus CBS 621.78 TaxID=1450534 RepID=A0ACD1GJM0_9EURO|nr:hypothetical protein BO95DRAFT_15279 [Aspergillus brunneoviolaceus CBS 621.78]RAH49360.1 hypothetical protein BO95DRAFT_15279 [Aspergillus brunneoviolaceus CBS 621.78]